MDNLYSIFFPSRYGDIFVTSYKEINTITRKEVYESLLLNKLCSFMKALLRQTTNEYQNQRLSYRGRLQAVAFLIS